LLVVLYRIDLLTVEGLVDDVVDRAPVRAPQLVGDVLAGASFGRQLDGGRAPGRRQCSVPVSTVDDGEGCGAAYENHSRPAMACRLALPRAA
jgi:hypothetical protein